MLACLLGDYQLRPMPKLKAAKVLPLDRQSDANAFPGVFDNDSLVYAKVGSTTTTPRCDVSVCLQLTFLFLIFVYSTGAC